MLTEIDLAGIYVPPFLAFAAATVPVFLLCRLALAHTGLLGRLWHPALFEFALSLSIVALFILVA